MKGTTVLFVLASVAFGQQTRQLTNQRIGDMVLAGVNQNEIIRIISSAPATSFDLRPGSTDNLLKVGVSEDIIKAMAAREEHGPTAGETGQGYAQHAESDASKSVAKPAPPLKSDRAQFQGREPPQQSISDADIRDAIERGKHSTSKQVWDEIKKQQQFRINRAGFDPIEKKVTFVSDSDRIALEAAEATRQLRELSVQDIRREVPLGITEVLFEANCYNNNYAASLPKWGPQGGVHLVLTINGSIVQPLARAAAPSDSVSILPQEHGVISRRGDTFTYTPLYRTAIYERASRRAWFVFPMLAADVRALTVTAISGTGNHKEKEIKNPFH